MWVMKNKSILQYYGSKYKMAQFIIDHFPENYKELTYIEPFFGSGSVFFYKEQGIASEIINDLDDDLIHFYQTCIDQPTKMYKALTRVVHSETLWKRARKVIIKEIEPKDDIDRATSLYLTLNATFTHSSHCHTFQINSKSHYQQGIMGNKRIKLNWIPFIKRLKYAMILNRDGLKIISSFNEKHCFLYLDPPYYGTYQVYKNKFKEPQFSKMIDLLKNYKGKFLLSTYFFKGIPKNWNVVYKKTHTTMSILHKTVYKKNRKECLIMNYDPKQKQLNMF